MSTPIKWGQEIAVNTTTLSTQDQPAIVALANGRFVAVWRDIGQTGGDTSGQAVRGQMLDADGSKFGGEFLVNTTTTDDQWNPKVIALSDGRFVVTFQDNSKTGGDTSQSAIRAQMYSATGARDGGEFLVNTTTAFAQNTPVGAALSDGKFVISWIDFSAVVDTAPAGIRAQMFNANGSKFGAEFLVNSTTAGNQVYPTITTLADGNFVVAWINFEQGRPRHLEQRDPCAHLQRRRRAVWRGLRRQHDDAGRTGGAARHEVSRAAASW